ncbi:MAG TPA: PfkB family carbohydrate kinase [Armatimonadota bacterium]|nr:PfkB family carbohydrate kinase [Armatimonadota bacterium]HOS43331.1 PfkB family carbohydrate kinase [Armatimonadota bacterium]
MPDVTCLGEVLIDFTSLQPGASLIETPGFAKHAGGAPANVAVAVSMLGGAAAFVGMVGDDEFGRYLAGMLGERGVDIGGLRASADAHTTLAFVALRADGEREFIFYRNPGADMLYGPDDLDEGRIAESRILHHGSISFISEANRAATLRAVEIARRQGALISYDPNLRLNLWPSADAARAGIALGLPTADLLKISEEELAFITGETEIAAGMALLRAQGVPVVIVTRGAAGCAYSWGDETGHLPGVPVRQVDATGAGDAFVGAVLYRLTRETPVALARRREEIEEILAFANRAAAIVVTRQGAIPAMPTLEELARAC